MVTVFVVMIGCILYGINRPKREPPNATETGESNKSSTVAVSTKEVIPEGFVKIGGVVRPAHDIESQRTSPQREALEGYNPGFTPKLSRNANANTQSIFEAKNNQDLAYRISSMIPAPKFDAKAYEEDPQAYLDEVAPARIWQSLPPSQEVAAIERAGAYFQTLIQGEGAILRVKVTPKMPVTFYSSKLGQFDNQLSHITLQADENGYAQTRFLASTGTRGEIDVIASSPVHSDYARWLIEVLPPEKVEQ